MANTREEIILAEQLEYYRLRAAEYDEWWLRTGRYDRGPSLNDQWLRDRRLLETALSEFGPTGRILEFAGGTGIWSERLCPLAEKLTIIDGSTEMLEINKARLRSPKAECIQADIFKWKPTGQFDVVFFSFWLSHVPPSRFAAFWEMVAVCLAPGGRVFFIDSRYEQSSTAVDQKLPNQEAINLRRRLNDGREFEIYKIFYERYELTSRLRKLGWDFCVVETPHYFLYGSGKRLCE